MRRRLARGAGIPFNRLTAIALICAAMLPAGILGTVVYGGVDRALAADALVRTEQAAAAATLHVREAQAELDSLATSYATWPVFERMVGGDQLSAAHDDVIAFLVGQGSVAAGRVETTTGSVSAGEPTVAAALGELASAPATSPTVLVVDQAVYLGTSQPIGDPANPARTVGRIALARRLDALFVAGLATLTGYSVTVAGPAGSAIIATDPATAAVAITATRGVGNVVRKDDVVAVRAHLDGPGGGADLVLSSRVSVLQSTASGLPLLILILLLATAAFALTLAGILARILGRRLGVVHDALAAVADGRVPPQRAARGDDDITRVAAGLDRLVATLDRRETVLRRSLASAAAVPINLSAAEAGHALAVATLDIFGLAWVRIVEPDGSVLAEAGAPPVAEGVVPMPESGAMAGAGLPGPAGALPVPGLEARVVEAAAGLGTGGRHLEAGLSGTASWSDGDQAGLEVMALLAGGVISEAEQYGVAAGRAERLDRLNRLQREFLRGVSHNLRTPLATIELAASDLLDGNPDEYVRHRAEAIRLEERRLARLVSQVLLLSRMDSGTLELEGEPVALAPLARRVANELSLRDRVTFHEQAAGAVAITDEAATEQIVWILLDNAARYAPSGPITVEVLPGEMLNGEPAILLAVQDEGPGVAPGDERRIFRRFARGSTSLGTDGTGVGLSVARGLARALGGDVAYRRATRGARFEVTLPSSGPALEAELGRSMASGAT